MTIPHVSHEENEQKSIVHFVLLVCVELTSGCSRMADNGVIVIVLG